MCITTTEIVYALGLISGADWMGILLLCLAGTVLLEIIDNPSKKKTKNAKKK